jgi:hypothetical protein
MAAQLTTLKATQADGMYYPPHWRPEMGSLDKMHGMQSISLVEKFYFKFQAVTILLTKPRKSKKEFSL